MTPLNHRRHAARPRIVPSTMLFLGLLLALLAGCSAEPATDGPFDVLITNARG